MRSDALHPTTEVMGSKQIVGFGCETQILSNLRIPLPPPKAAAKAVSEAVRPGIANPLTLADLRFALRSLAPNSLRARKPSAVRLLEVTGPNK